LQPEDEDRIWYIGIGAIYIQKTVVDVWLWGVAKR
jgi:hypothetical protein